MTGQSPGEVYRLAVTVTCKRCEKRVDGYIMFGSRNEIVDSQGFVVFSDGPVCDSCLDEQDALHSN